MSNQEDRGLEKGGGALVQEDTYPSEWYFIVCWFFVFDKTSMPEANFYYLTVNLTSHHSRWCGCVYLPDKYLCLLCQEEHWREKPSCWGNLRTPQSSWFFPISPFKMKVSLTYILIPKEILMIKWFQIKHLYLHSFPTKLYYKKEI